MVIPGLLSIAAGLVLAYLKRPVLASIVFGAGVAILVYVSAGRG